MLATKSVHELLEQAYKEGRLVSKILSFDRDFIELSSRYPNNNLEFIYTLKDGRLHGCGRRWYENGQVQREDPYHKSVLHGCQRLWYTHGVVRCEMSYINNHLNGTRREWYPSGRLKMECRYVMNRLEGNCTEWHGNGQIKERTPYWEGEPHGIIKRFDENGKSLPKEIYVRGLRYTGRIKRLVNAKRLNVGILSRLGSAAIRRFLIEEIGYARLLREANAQSIDQDGECELFRCRWHPDEEPLYLVKVKCPSTGAFYTLRVAPHVRTVREAIAWTFSLEASRYSPQEES